MFSVCVHTHTHRVFHGKGITSPLPHIGGHIGPGCLSFSDINIDQWVEYEMDDIQRCQKKHPKSEINIFLVLKMAFYHKHINQYTSINSYYINPSILFHDHFIFENSCCVYFL